MKQPALALAIGALGIALSAAAQSKPNFAGIWISVPDPASRGSETQLVIEQTAGELVIEHQSQAGPYKLLYKLDGSETTNTIPGRVGRGAAATATSVAAWEGNTLVIKTNIPRGTPPDVRTIRYREVLSIESDGRLVIEQSASLADGPTQTNRQVYRKKSAWADLEINPPYVPARPSSNSLAVRPVIGSRRSGAISASG
ncbi:MAG TPA: hypothetical protein VES67_00620 [Vicinamibacterales bacterium]|nr:hypothetical protein [Vicinamibacterales bacterium]